MNNTAGSPFRDVLGAIGRDVQPMDIYVSVMCAIYSTLALVLYPFVPMASAVLSQNAMIVGIAASTILLRSYTGMAVFSMARYFYVIPVIYLMYDQTHVFVRVLRPVDYDYILIAADRLLFGTDPTVWLRKISFPALTEYLQICYFLFYLMPIMQAIELWRRGEMDLLSSFARKMAFVYFISYLLYFVLPAIGPRFTLHNFGNLNLELPGLFLTDILRQIVNAGGGVPPGTADPVLHVNRDCMPSGHTMLTLANVILAYKNRSRHRVLFLVIGGSLIISTVYLDYHYVVDVLVGAALTLVLLPVEPLVAEYLQRFQKKLFNS